MTPSPKCRLPTMRTNDVDVSVAAPPTSGACTSETVLFQAYSRATAVADYSGPGRAEICACGGMIVASGPSTYDIKRAVDTHRATHQHATWASAWLADGVE